MICFAILAHSKQDVLENQIENIRKYNTGCKIVLYNGGIDPEFGKNASVPICPYSRPLEKGKLGHFFLGVMRWLEEIGEEYDYLVNLDSDVMFIQKGYEEALNREMNGYDGMGINMGSQHSPDEVLHWYPGQTMWREWHRWQPFFQTDYFYGSLNSMQVYRRETVHKMMHGLDIKRLEELIDATEVFALEELLYPTLAARSGARLRSYPYQYGTFVRLGENLKIEDLVEAKKQPLVFFVHPIDRSLENEARRWINSQGEDKRLVINERPKTLTISWGCFQGGVETALLYRLKAMTDRGYESHAYFYYGGTGLNCYSDIHYKVSKNKDDLAEYIRIHQFQVITFINTLYNLDILNEVGFKGKVFFEFHGEGKRIFEELERIDKGETEYEINGIIVPSHNVKSIAHKYIVTRKDLPIHVAFNTLDTDQFKQHNNDQFYKSYQIPDNFLNRPPIGWVGRLDSNKNWYLMLRIFHELKHSIGMDTKLLIASDLPHSPELNPFLKMAMKYELIEDIHILPNIPHDEMPFFYSLIASSGGVLLSTSRSEGYPYNILEAQACYCPVVCTDIPGTNEIVSHRNTGLNYPLNDSPSTAAKYVYEVITDKSLYEQITQNARKQVAFKNNIHTNTEAFIQWVTQMLREVAE
ncbi:glycosyltransferase family 4 protein [Neobacillus cucumis]|uniref:glycosyltransferase family 4 protein n=1 Tax=Neobacillus cucumis TaxID=1740721 RepID=UPI002E1F4AE1|nr:glycosyltransferase family 4 protein [Neobacillus cucumis]